MKYIKFTLFSVLLFLLSSISKESPNVHFIIKKEDPGVGLTLGYNLPEEQLQDIVGDQFKPQIKNGKGFLMIFIASSSHYFIDSNKCDDLAIAHLIVPIEGVTTLNAPLTISSKKQKINTLLRKHHFKMKLGKVNLNVNKKGDSLLIQANIQTSKGSIDLSSTVLNDPGPLRTFESTRITSTNQPNRYFIGPESYKAVEVGSINIKSLGKNWISELNLPLKPDRVWLSVDFSWDFIFYGK